MATNWSCSQCTFSNKVSDELCRMCRASRWEVEKRDRSPNREIPREGEVTLKRRPRGGLFARLRGSWEMYWSCPQCTRHNDENMRICEACGYIGTNIRNQKGASSSHQETRDRTSNVGQFFKKVFRSISEDRREDVTSVPSANSNQEWVCPQCTFTNHPQLMYCEQCETARVIQTDRENPHPPTNSHDSTNRTSEHLIIVPTNEGEVLIGNEAVLRTLTAPSTNEEERRQDGDTRIKPQSMYPSLSTLESQPSTSLPSNQWVCPMCTTENSRQHSYCYICQLGVRPGGVVNASTPITGMNDLSMDVQSESKMVSFQRQQSRSETVKDIQQRQQDHAMTIWYNIVEEYKRLKESFIDPDFPHSDRSLYLRPDKPVLKWEIAGWLRPSRVRSIFNVTFSGEWCVYRDPRPSDIAQGSLGNCWFLSALAVIAEYPELLQQIIITKELCPEGVYQVRLCQDGLWKVILIDDFFPVFEDSRLAFSKARRKQLWVPLIEKALAKMYGSYQALDGGHIVGGLSVLTGYPCEKLRLQGDDSSVDNELTWGKLLSFKESKYPMAVSTSPMDSTDVQFDDVGINPFHAYSVLDVKQIGSERLVLLRDPWGHTDWKGHGHQWIESEPGTFWVGANDLFKYFSQVDVCHYHPDWHSVRVCGQLPPYAPSHLQVLTFQIFAPTEISLCLYQPSYRGREEESHKKVDIALLVVQYEDHEESLHAGSLPYPKECVLASKCQLISTITCSSILSPGRYAIIPMSYRNWHRFEVTSHDGHVPYVLALFSAKVLEWQEQVPTKPGFMAESLFLLAKKEGVEKKLQSSVTLYEVFLHRSCHYLVVENNHPRYHLTVTCNAMESVNAASSRQGLLIQDCLPPQHRQVLMVLTPLTDVSSLLIHHSLQFQLHPTNTMGQWGSVLSPPLNDTNRELHSPRPNYNTTNQYYYQL